MRGPTETAAEGWAPRETMMRMIMGFALAPMLHVAAKLGVADRLVDEPRDVHRLAQELDVDGDALTRLLLALATYGVFAQEGEEFRLTALGELLRSRPGSLRATALYWGAPWIWNAWGQLFASVKTGSPAFDRIHGTDFFAFLAQHHEASRIFDDFMTETPSQRHAAIAAAYDFAAGGTVVDVGGGRGATLAAILLRHPALRGILFDRTDPNGAGTPLGDPSLAHRCVVIAGDFFATIPDGGDYYILSSVLHDWSDAQAVAILRNCRRAMSPGAKLLVVERVIESGADHTITRTLDMCMLALLGGRERTAAEFGQLCAAAGFEVRRILPTASPFKIIEGGFFSANAPAGAG
jgi:O-methyltransferase domain